MRWSWRIGQLFGIAVYIHATFPLILIWSAIQYGREGGATDAFMGVIFVLCVFGVVVLHELGHALTARRFGIATRDIILLPIGGVARLERIPEEPKQELLIAVAGPAVNVVLAVLFASILTLVGSPVSIALWYGAEGTFLNNLVWVNVFLVLFNAIPAFPMDGGRVLRAILALRLPYSRATQIAAGVGKAFAVLFALIGFTQGMPFLIFIAIFVWIGASGEASMVRFRHDLGGAITDDLVIREVLTLAPDDPLEKGIEIVLAGFQPDFPVLQDGQLIGLLTREDLLKALSTRGKSSSVRDAMRVSFPVAALNDPVEEVFAKLQQAGVRTVPVLTNGVFQGVVTTENIAEYLMVRAALRGKGA